MRELIQSFLEPLGYGEAFLSPIPRDASKRQYLRMEGKGKLLMVSPSSEKPEQFMRIGKLLESIHLSSPKFFDISEKDDLYVIEDFGDNTYRKALLKENEEMLYTLAVDVLSHLSKELSLKPDFLKDYDRNVAFHEALLFLEWYGHGFSEKEEEAFKNILDDLFIEFPSPKTLILRDYHIDNLFYLKDRTGLKKCGLIDFQDAMWGPLGYDLISLTHDVRRDTPETLKEMLTARYLEGFPASEHSTLRHTFDLLNLVRHLRIFGVFSRLSKRDEKHHYVDHFPRMWRHIQTLLDKNESFGELAYWLYETGVMS